MRLKYLVPVIIWFLILSAPVSAQELTGPQAENPWHLSVDLGVLVMTSNSTLDTNGARKITDNTEKGKAPKSIWTFPLFDLRYQFSTTQTQLFFGTPVQGSDIALSLGVIQPIPKTGILTLSIAPSYDMSLWKNPYEEQTNREKTPVDILTTMIKLDRVAFTPLNIDYSHRQIDVADDEIGSMYSGLQRSGDIQSLKATYDVALSKTSLVSPGLTLEKGDFKGDSESYQQAGLVVSYKRMVHRAVFVIEAMASQSVFQTEHPLYAKTRKEASASTFALVRVQDLFGVKNLHSNTILGCGFIDANINFFDVDTAYAALTVGYSF